MNRFAPRLVRIYDIGSVLRVKFILNVGEPNELDTIGVQFYPSDITSEFFQIVFDEKALLFANNKFQQERKQFLKNYYPDRFERIFQ